MFLQKTVVALLVALALGWVAPAQADNQPFTIRGEAAILGDLDSGAILFEQEADVQREPASLTKVMTLYLLYEALANGELTLETMLPVSERAWRMEGSKTFVRVGDEVAVADLIRGIAVQSGNDACIVVAEHMGGSENGFVDMMNRKARELGMTGTHFMNASGMPTTDHHTTARDMFTLARALILDFPQFSHFVREKQFVYNGIQQYNRNRLLWRDPSITGLKTGHTSAAGYCLIATNEMEGQRLGAVVMGAASSKIREEEALRLLRYGNRTFETVRLFEAGDSVRRLRIWKGAVDQVEATLPESLLITVPRRDRNRLEVGLRYQEPLLAPLAQGDRIGTLVIKLGEEEIMSRPVVAAHPVAEGGILSQLMDSIQMQLGW